MLEPRSLSDQATSARLLLDDDPRPVGIILSQASLRPKLGDRRGDLSAQSGRHNLRIFEFTRDRANFFACLALNENEAENEPVQKRRSALLRSNRLDNLGFRVGRTLIAGAGAITGAWRAH